MRPPVEQTHAITNARSPDNNPWVVTSQPSLSPTSPRNSVSSGDAHDESDRGVLSDLWERDDDFICSFRNNVLAANAGTGSPWASAANAARSRPGRQARKGETEGGGGGEEAGEGERTRKQPRMSPPARAGSLSPEAPVMHSLFLITFLSIYKSQNCK